MLSALIERSGGYVLFHGRTEWLSDGLLADLNDEAEQCRSRAQQVARQAHSVAGPKAHALAHDRSLVDVVERLAGYPVTPSGNANYLYYDEPGARIDPHIDSPDFPLQVLLILQQSGYDASRSTLVVFPDGPKSAVQVPLDPGEFTVFKAS